MSRSLRLTLKSSLLFLCLLSFSQFTFAQTPGLIYKIATNGGNKVLDPNGDGYVSKNPNGFQLVNGVRLDEGTDYSEIPYRPFPVFMDEPLADLKTGGSYGHTDYAPKVYDSNGKPIGSPLASYFDGKNFLFRVRLAGQSTASKGYSILIDTNGSLTGTGTNPGFEFEVLLATNFDVRVYDHRTNTTGGDIIFSGSVDQYSQKAIAGSTGGGDADYFYDFYVPMSAFGGAITPTTSLRMTGVTVTSAKSGIFGVASDIGGVDDKAVTGTIQDIWKAVINNTPVSTPTDIKDIGFTPVAAAAPRVSSPIYANSTSISGSSGDAQGSVITVSRNGTQIGTTTVLADGSWNLTLGAVTLAINDEITARVKPIEKSLSATSASVVVQAKTFCNVTPPVMTIINGNKGFTGQTSEAGTINVYLDNSPNPPTLVATGTFTTNVTWILEFAKSGQSISAGIYYSTFTPQNASNCESLPSNQICSTGGTGNNSSSTAPTPNLNQGILTPTNLTLTGTATTANATIAIYKNGVEIGRTTSSATAASGSYAWSFVYNQSVNNGEEFYARTLITSPCTTASAKSTSYIATIASSAPSITGTYCGPTTIVSGTSTEAAGTTIRVLVSGTEVGQTTVNAYGTWSATISSRSSGTITATATAPNKSISVASAGVTITPLFSASGLAITDTSTNETIKEGSTSVKGTATVPDGSIVTLYISGSPYVDKDGNKIYAVVTGNSFTFPDISPFELYAGATLTVTAKANAAANCESAPSTPAYIVACNDVNTEVTATFTQARFCPDTPAFIRLSTTEPGIIYNIYRNGLPFGPSKLGTGSGLTLQSDPVTAANTMLEVRTIKVGANCQSTIGSPMIVDLYPAVPRNFTVIASPSASASCANYEVTLTVQNAEIGYSYQLIFNNTAKDKIGPALVPTVNGNISFPVVTVSQTTTYGVVITGTESGCVAENTILQTITISGGPDVNRTITADQTAICVGTSATIIVATENSYTYHIYQEDVASHLTEFTGNGSNMGTTLTTPFATTGTKQFYVTVSSGTCQNLVMTNRVTITVTDGTGGTVSAGPDRTIAADNYTLQGSSAAPGTGTWTVVNKPAPANPVFAAPNQYNSQVSGLISGTYEFKWEVTSACAGGSSASDNVVIIVNYPAEYSVRSNKLVTEYVVNETLATVTDPEGIASVQLLTAQELLPNGVSLNTSTGLLRVSDIDVLTTGNYNFALRVTDLAGKTTDLPLTLRFYSPVQRPGDIQPLPVELVYFTASTTTNGVLLQWLTASETDNDRFEIERSSDGKAFTKIGTVNGNGTSNRAIKYNFTDTQPLADVSYYRLKQVDYDGTSNYSKTISIRNKKLSANAVLQAYPNPFSEKLLVTVTAPEAEQAVLILYNLQGRVLLTKPVELQQNINNFELDTQQLATGVYILKITGTSTDVTAKVLKR